MKLLNQENKGHIFKVVLGRNFEPGRNMARRQHWQGVNSSLLARKPVLKYCPLGRGAICSVIDTISENTVYEEGMLSQVLLRLSYW
jgi:hypothetical protein